MVIPQRIKYNQTIAKHVYCEKVETKKQEIEYKFKESKISKISNKSKRKIDKYSTNIVKYITNISDNCKLMPTVLRNYKIQKNLELVKLHEIKFHEQLKTFDSNDK